ncbi:MAG: tripartite tricarboxylate transporter substrate binding protein BugD [Betaproteobacteria bacterium]|nr:tripartite tricarboxylate transporter substrate binding protein BugD [Betaproteobacteria bacterium]
MIRLFAAAALAAFAGLAAAQPFPSRPVTLVVPFPPGGSTDTAARLIGEAMRPSLGQPVVTENVGGANGSIALARVARSAPDGYTIDIGQWDTHVGAIIYPISFDLEKDFAPIGLMSINPQLLIARKNFPADDLKGLVAWMKANPGSATLVEQTSAAKLGGLLLQKATGSEIRFIPFRGAAPGMQALLGDQVDLLIAQAAVIMPHVRAGAVKLFANLSPARSPSLPNVPTADEAGVRGLYLSGWFGLFAPRGTPKEVVAKLNSSMAQALLDPKVRERFAELGLDIAGKEQQSPEGFAAFLKADMDKWWPIIKAANIKVE